MAVLFLPLLVCLGLFTNTQVAAGECCTNPWARRSLVDPCAHPFAPALHVTEVRYIRSYVAIANTYM